MLSLKKLYFWVKSAKYTQNADYAVNIAVEITCLLSHYKL